ncbi:MAG TPA: parallel beta-helix domain-containing protein [Kofleriaceae bacterium]|nr:parallel beta-helix domain-containing protein [Kofleriaceae bacterium]
MKRAAIALVLLGACSSEDPCADVTGPCIALTEGADAEEVQTALIEVEPGGTVAFGKGTFEFEVDLSLDVDGVTIRGAGRDETTLSFANQTSGPQGMLVTANAFTIEDIGFEDSPGDALKVLGADGVTMRRVRVEWTGGPMVTNGAYGLYPVQCKNVLIEDSIVLGASDAGIYVGQSTNIVVRNNVARNNVAGIEIENSFQADVTGNTATQNTGGILVFNLPGLQVENGTGTRVYGNEVFENNTPNFAPEGNIVGSVPTGTGIVLLAAHGVEIFDNDVRDHRSINIGIISYVPIGDPKDPSYDIYPTAIHIHDNRISGTSDRPSGDLGLALIAAVGQIAPNGPLVVPDIAWDGVVDPARAGSEPDRICIRGNGDADFINLAWPLEDTMLPTRELAPHDCSHAPLPAVQL